MAATLLATLAIAAALVFLVELVARGSLDSTLRFFYEPFKPSWTTVALFALLLLAADALIGRPHQSLLIVAPVFLVLAFVGHQKSYYLGDPLYPTDFLYARQIVELMPLLVRERPLTGVAIVAAVLAGIAALVLAWRYWHRRTPIMTRRGRAMRLAFALPVLAFFASIMDYATFSWTRDRLQIVPMMWDQKENYASNGFAIAFALNLPMAKVSAPAGYSKAAIDAIDAPAPAVALPPERPDIIVVMSESFWDPTALPGVTLAPDPIPTVRANLSGHSFSPEFGGMTANVEFEALTGFSNAYLPYGSIPYQQYVRRPLPSMARFLRGEGYETIAIHPFEGWFWNRKAVYDALGFETFYAKENLPPLPTRGPLASDAALTDEIIKLIEEANGPTFTFAVSLQNHGPYEANRYPDSRIAVTTDAPVATARSIATFAEGMRDSDQALRQLMEWASKRDRPTVIAFFGDHLPPLGPAYVDTGFLPSPTAPRKGSATEMEKNRNTPLVIWSNDKGTLRDIGTVSPSLLPLHILATAGIEHPYYTGFLKEVGQSYRVVDRNILIDTAGGSVQDWARSGTVDPVIESQRMLQFDLMFGEGFGGQRFFPPPHRPRYVS